MIKSSVVFYGGLFTNNLTVSFGMIADVYYNVIFNSLRTIYCYIVKIGVNIPLKL